MTILYTLIKIRKYIWSKIVNTTYGKSYYPLIYKSSWHAFMHKPKEIINDLNYFTAIPNHGAGIGHQLANWIAGFWFAKQLNLKYAYTSFANERWEYFLGFGENEKRAIDLLNKNYKKIKLPLFDEFNPNEIELIKKIIFSYKDKQVVFVAEQDQSYTDQYGVIDDIKNKFHNAPARENDKLIYTENRYNIAIHVRRGDIVAGQINQNPNLIMRWQDNDYFQKVLTTVIEKLGNNKAIEIYLFSQGEISDFDDFKKFDNIHFCLNMEAQASFLHMVYADLLITSKSSFSYKPALLSNGIKVCPRDFWHRYPNNDQWILVENDGTICKTESEKINQICNSI